MPATLEQLMDTKADLHPDLEAAKCKADGLGWDCIKHPLLFAVPYMPEMNAVYNKQYECRAATVEKAVVEKNWSRILGFTERPYRFQTFMEHMGLMTNAEYWENLGWLWTDSENLWQVGKRELRGLLNSERSGRELMMDPEEREALAALPETFPVYRGHGPKNKWGFSWTLDLAKAAWFANRFTRKGERQLVTEGACLKANAVALFLGRNEKEIVTDPMKLKALKNVNLNDRGPQP